MTESEVREVFKSLKSSNPTSLMIVPDGDSVSHAEIHNDDGLLWIYPKNSRRKLVNHNYSAYGNQANITVVRPRGGEDYAGMERQFIV